MVKVKLPQNIPSELQDQYDGAMTNEPYLPETGKVKQRLPFRIPSLWGFRTIRPPVPRGAKVTDAMGVNRVDFGKCVKCWQKQPATGGVTPPTWGARSRAWWFADTNNPGFWYYNWFIYASMIFFKAGNVPPWCKSLDFHTSYCTTENIYTSYDGDTFAHVVEYPTTQWWSYFWRNDEAFDTYYMRVQSVTPFYPPEVPYILGIYKTDWPEDWGAITWFHKPPVGDLISTVEIYREPLNKLYPIFIGDNKKWVIKGISAEVQIGFNGPSFPDPYKSWLGS